MICPLGITEVERAVRESAVLQRNPSARGQVRGGFHQDGNVGGTRDVETETVAAHAKAGIAGLRLRIPQKCRTVRESGAPARGAGTVEDGNKGGAIEQRALFVPIRLIPFEIQTRQAGAAIECPLPNGDHAAGDPESRQAGATPERIFSDRGNAFADGDTRQASATPEHVVPK